MPQPWLRVAVHIDDLGPDWVTVPFVVDTGAARTCVHAMDAIRLFGMSPASLDPTSWAHPTFLGGIGGGLNYLTRTATYAFLRDDGQFHLIEGDIQIGELRSQRTPALLGCDLLRHFKLQMDGGSQVTLEPIPE